MYRNATNRRPESPWTLNRSSISSRLPPLGVCYFPSVIREEDKVISKQLKPGTSLELALSCLGSFTDFNGILSRKKTRLSKVMRTLPVDGAYSS
jgi:hypothetical protein